MKVKKDNLSDKERTETLDALYTAAAAIHGRDAMKLFLRDLLTESERLMLGRRIIIARALLNGEEIDDIAERMRVGYDTIYRIRRWLVDQLPGYEKALEGLEKEYESRERKYSKPKMGTMAYLKKKYPLHFLLFPSPKYSRKKTYDIS